LDSHVRRPGPPERNRNTELLTAGQPASAAELRAAYQLARGAAAMLPPTAPGHRLIWVRGASFAATALVAADNAFAIVGRHTQCGVVLPDDPFVALRHLLVRSVALPSGGLALRIFDLHTDLGFSLVDGSRQSSIFAEGPVAIGVGEYALVALPSETADNQLPGELPAPVVETPAAVRDQLKVLEAAMSPYRANARPVNRTTRITLMPMLVMVGEPLPPSLGRLTGGTYGLSLDRGGRSAGVRLSDEDLARGVLIGRSEKCHSEDLRRITTIGTSRVHLLLLKEGTQVHAYDLASTQGTYSSGAPVRRVALPDTGATLYLGSTAEAVRFTWHRRG
jgi:hypothetical protein